MSPTVTAAPSWTLGWRLRRSLEHAGLSREVIARELDVAPTTISRWMHDQGRMPRHIYLRHWAVICSVPYEWLIGADEVNPIGPDQGEYTGGEAVRRPSKLPRRDSNTQPAGCVGRFRNAA